MGKFAGWFGGIFLGAIANCIAGHMVNCVFRAVGIDCPFED